MFYSSLNSSLKISNKEQGNIKNNIATQGDPEYAEHLVTTMPINSKEILTKKRLISSLISRQRELEKFQGPAIINEDHRHTRNTFFTLASIGLVGNIGYALFRYKVAYQGLVEIGFPAELSEFLALTGAILDFFATIFSVSPMNNTNASVFSDVTHLSSKTLWLNQLTFAIACCTAYPIGGAAGFLGILPYLASYPDTTFYTIAIIAAIFLVSAGIFNFISFNLSSDAKTFAALENYFKATKADHDISRELQIIIECASVVIYRALSNAAIAMSIAPSLRLPISNTAQLLLAGIIFTGTSINVSSTRLIKTVNQWSNNLFAYITVKEKTDALASLNYLIYFNLNTAAGTVMAIGLGMMIKSFIHSSAGNNWIAPAVILGSMLLAITIAAQRSLAINKEAKKTINEMELNKRIEYAKKNAAEVVYFKNSFENDTNDIIQPLLLRGDMDYRQKKIKAANSAFAILAETFVDIPGLQIFAIICSIGGRVVRFAGFLHFTDVIATLFGIEFSPESIVGTSLAVAPPNLSNEYHMFKDGMIEIITQKIAETYVTYCVATKNIQTTTKNASFQSWLKNNKSALFYPLYTKGALDYEAEDIAHALGQRAKDLGYLSPTNT